MIWKNDFLDKIRNYWKSKINKLQIETAEGVFTDIETIEKSIDGNAIKIIAKIPAGNDFTILSVRIIDTDGDTAGEITESVSKMSDDEFYVLFRFPLYEI